MSLHSVPRLPADAEQVAADAARVAGVSVRELRDQEVLARASRLFAEVWSADNAESVMTAPLMTALAHSGGYVVGAFREEQLVGASVGFLGRDERGLFLHSHVTGVRTDLQTRGVGFALKQHQRAWALANGIETIRWTFDPLVRANGYFNITKLGAEIVSYHQNFYGVMPDGINGNDETDRCMVWWSLTSERTRAAAAGTRPDPADPSQTAEVVLTQMPDGSPRFEAGSATTLQAFVPPDIVPLRQNDPGLAGEWRRALRSCLEWAFARGYIVDGMTRDGFYLLRRAR